MVFMSKRREYTKPETEVRGVIGREEEVGVVVVVVETTKELFLAFPYTTFLEPTRGIILLNAFAPPGSVFSDWRTEDALPTRGCDPGEMCFSIIR
jgi:hypothetical protein